MYAVVRVRGSVNLRKELKDTLKMLRLIRINHCILLRRDPAVEGMIRKVKDFVTWGEIDDKTLEKLVSERGRLTGDNKIEAKQAKIFIEKIRKAKNITEVEGLKPVFRMNPPKKGYRHVKLPYPKGALGYRGEKINDLLQRMM